MRVSGHDMTTLMRNGEGDGRMRPGANGWGADGWGADGWVGGGGVH